MIRGTTPLLEFEFLFDTSQFAEAFLTFAQNRTVVLEKKLADCQVDTNTLSVRLKQEETLKFLPCTAIEIQVRIRTLEGEALASDIIVDWPERILKDGVI